MYTIFNYFICSVAGNMVVSFLYFLASLSAKSYDKCNKYGGEWP